LLALLLPVFGSKLDVELLKKRWDLVLLEVHDSGKNSENWVENELIESAIQGLALMACLIGPLLGVWVEVVVTLCICQ
jgi:hypothetical protein